jgi:pSer/pThr/pTyr-binding forkhead associated (FHA) protein
LGNKPQTVAVRPEGSAPPATADGDHLDSLLHQSTPQLFVKGGGLKRSIRLMKAISKIGRDETADVPLPHETVSEQHAEIHFDGTNWTLLDSGSTNGCIVDGQHLRSTAQIVQRNSLINIGNLHLIFLCNSKKTASQDRRDELRALQLLNNGGRIDKITANEIRQMVRADASQSIAEIVLRDTQLTPVDWADAVATARRKVSFFARITRLFTGRKQGN